MNGPECFCVVIEKQLHIDSLRLLELARTTRRNHRCIVLLVQFDRVPPGAIR